MIENIKNILKNMDNVNDWIIVKKIRKSTEVFLIKDKIDMNRACNSEDYKIHVFVDFEDDEKKYRGDANINIGASSTDAEIEEKVKEAVFAAGFVKNLWYDLPAKEDGKYIEIQAYENNKTLKEKFDDLHKVIYKKYNYQAEVNSCEVFAIEGKNRVVTSKGVDVEYPVSEFSFEIVTDSNIGKEPVEIFNGYYLKNIDLNEIEKIIDKQLMETEGRSKAIRNKKLENMRVIISNEAVEEFFYFYFEQAKDASIYQKISKAKIGENFQKADARQKITFKINPALATSLNAKPVDEEGKKLSEYFLYKDGVVENLVTSAKFSHYLGVENKGKCITFEVETGDESISEYRKGDYLEVYAFSSFLMDPTTGDFGGEFRLAKLVENGKEKYVTGGSISENIFDTQDSMMFSSEKAIRKNSVAPQAIVFDGLTIAGE